MGNDAIEIKSGYKLTLKGNGISVDQEISAMLAKNIITMIFEDGIPQASPKAPANTVTTPQNYGQQQNSSSTPKKSLREYLNEIGPRKNPQKILVIANYLVTFLGKETFSVADIKPLFRVASESLPANLSRDFQIVSQYGWIAPDHEDRKMFFITKTGLDALSNKFE